MRDTDQHLPFWPVTTGKVAMEEPENRPFGPVKADVLRRELDWIRDNQHRWNQAEWMDIKEGISVAQWDNMNLLGKAPAEVANACGSTGCLAGNGAVREGLAEVDTYVYRDIELDEDGNRVEQKFVSVNFKPKGGDWHYAGAQAFGLTREEAELLFSGGNSLYRLYALASEFTDGEIEVPADLPVDDPAGGCDCLVCAGYRPAPVEEPPR